jgi:hypothetical protein
MAETSKPKTSRERQRAYRARMRARGMKPITIWVPDPDSPAFAAEARRQSRLVDGADAREHQEFMNEIMDLGSE